ncbi:Cupredoxin [Lactarius tabidus]|jgi:plastocyanin
MKFSIALTAVLLPAFVNAQSSSSSSAAAPSASASNSNNIKVSVGANDALVYTPSAITAANGTTVTFVFTDEPHSVTQSTFDNPCTYLAAANGSSGGFDSGLQTGKQFTLTITNDQEPVWFFCKAPQHCGAGMVGSINAPSTGNTAAAFLAAAKAIGSSEPTVTDSGPVTGGVDAVATSTPTSTSASSSSPSPSSSKSSDARRLVASGVFALLAPAFGIALA